MRLVQHRNIPEDAELRRQWNALVAALDQTQVFYTYEWSLAVQRAYSTSVRVRLFLGYDDRDLLCGIAAFASSGEDRMSFLCANTGDYCDFLSPPAHKGAFVGAVLAQLKSEGIRNLVLTNLPADSGTLQAIRGARGETGYHCFARTAYLCAQVSMEKIERRPGGNAPVLPRKKMVRRFLSAMSRESPVHLDHAKTFENIAPLLPKFTQAHIARFLMTGRISNMVRRERRAFLEELARLLAEPGWITLTRLTAGEKNFAWNYGFQFAGIWFWYQPTFDSDIEKYSPGFCLLAKMIEEAAADPACRVVDLGLGAEEYKDRFSNQSRRTLYVTLQTSAAECCREVLRYWTARVARMSPTVESALRACGSRLQRVKDQVAQEGAKATIRGILKRVRAFLWSEEEVFFFEWRGSECAAPDGNRLHRLDISQLATAAAQHEDDSQTLTYLLRAAARLRAGNADGFALVDRDGRFLHFAWTTAFDGFYLDELKAKADAPSSNCKMLFDCWTPLAARGRGYYAETVSRIAERVQGEGKSPWIFSAAQNTSSLRGLEKSGFQRRYSLTKQRRLFWHRVKGKTPRAAEAAVTEVSARA